MEKKLDSLRAELSELDRILVAFSGGVDSTVLLKIAVDTLGDRAAAVIVDSPLLPRHELEEARELAKEIGCDLLELKTREMDLPDFSANTPQRCYFCKDHRYSELNSYAVEHGYQEILDGSNADDLLDFRPGKKAAEEHKVRSPLQEAGFTKSEIRKLARKMGLSNWDKPSSACLASRIPYGIPVTIQRLQKIEKAERLLAGLGLKQVRVRHHGSIARIEVEPDDFQKIIDHRTEITQAFEKIGYDYVTLDMHGFQSGRLNKGINAHG